MDFAVIFRCQNYLYSISLPTGLYMIGYGRRNIILKFPPLCRLNEENQEQENSKHQMKTKTFLFSFDFEFEFLALEVPRS